MNQRAFDWRALGQWIVIVITLVGGGFWQYIQQDRRITTLEAEFNQQMAGYNIAIQGINGRLDKVDERLDRVFDGRSR